MRGFNVIKRGIALTLISLLLISCGDSPTPTTTPTTAAAPSATATPAQTTAAATTAIPATTVAATTAAATTATATTVAATTIAATTAAATTSTATTAAATGNFTVTDRSGAAITLAKKAERIVCLARDCVDFLSELGIEPVAISKDLLDLAANTKIFGDKAKVFALVGGSLFQPNLEDITKAKPDLIMGYDMLHTALREPLKNVAPLYLGFAKSSDEALGNFKVLARLVGKSEQAETSIAKFQARLAEYKAKSPKDKSALYFASGDGKVFTISTDQTLVCKLIAELGKCTATLPQNPGQFGAFGLAQFSLEQLVAFNPQVIFMPARADLIKPDQLKGTKLWDEIAAVKNQQVYTVSGDIWDNNGGIRAMNIMLDDIAIQFYPTIFPKPLG